MALSTNLAGCASIFPKWQELSGRGNNLSRGLMHGGNQRKKAAARARAAAHIEIPEYRGIAPVIRFIS
jgi:hypothetical protein